MKDTALAMAKRLLMDSIWKSANLEGLGTTYQKTEAIIRNAPTITTANEVLFVVNMKCAWQFLFNNLGRYNSLSYLEEFNRIVGNMLFRKRGIIRFLGMPPKSQLYFLLSKLYDGTPYAKTVYLLQSVVLLKARTMKVFFVMYSHLIVIQILLVQ